jgi:hypothetical protein
MTGERTFVFHSAALAAGSGPGCRGDRYPDKDISTGSVCSPIILFDQFFAVGGASSGATYAPIDRNTASLEFS